MKIGNRKSEIENPNAGYFASPVTRHPSPAFTLIELIIVIAIIAILATLVIAGSGMVDKRKKIALAQTQLKAVEQAIEGYKTKQGYYPPDNPLNPTNPPLYFELLGTTNNGSASTPPSIWVTMDNSAQITGNGSSSGDIYKYFNILGFANTATRAHSDDQGAAATSFINHLTQNQIASLDPNQQIKILICSVPWPPDKTPPPIASSPASTPFCYNLSHPTNSGGSYDLWVDIVVRGKTNRICNWSTQPIQL